MLLCLSLNDEKAVALGTLDPADSSVTHASDSAAHVRGGARLFIPSTFHLSCSDFITRPSAANSRIASRPTPVNYILGGRLLFTRTKFIGRFFVFAALFFFDCICLYNVAILYKNPSCISRIIHWVLLSFLCVCSLDSLKDSRFALIVHSCALALRTLAPSSTKLVRYSTQIISASHIRSPSTSSPTCSIAKGTINVTEVRMPIERGIDSRFTPRSKWKNKGIASACDAHHQTSGVSEAWSCNSKHRTGRSAK